MVVESYDGLIYLWIWSLLNRMFFKHMLKDWKGKEVHITHGDCYEGWSEVKDMLNKILVLI